MKNILAIYAREDNDLTLNLLRHLEPLKQDFDVSIWHDDPIYPGQAWKLQDASRLNQADIFLFLVSNTFMYSEFVKQTEFKMVIDRYKEGRAIIIPILLDKCPWNTDFKSDDYDFNMNELQVVPTDGRPISDWDSLDQALKHVSDQVTGLIASSIAGSERKEANESPTNMTSDTEDRSQIQLNFGEEEEADSVADEEKRRMEEAEAIKGAGEEQISEKEAEAEITAEQQKKSWEEIQAKKRTEEEQKILLEEARAKRKIKEDNRIKEAAAAIKARDEEWRKFKEEADAKGINETADRPEYTAKSNENFEETALAKNTGSKRKRLVLLSIVALAIAGVWTFTVFNKGTKKPIVAQPKTEATDIDGAGAVLETETDAAKQEEASNLEPGDAFKEGIVFSIDPSGKTGIIAFSKDMGPMPWKNAMKIHEQLGEGWRLPTMDELAIMYKTIGQGATNSGQFSDELYWSATPYDADQARLLRFSDGNTSFHYNSRATYREFRVRAVRDFKR